MKIASWEREWLIYEHLELLHDNIYIGHDRLGAKRVQIVDEISIFAGPYSEREALRVFCLPKHVRNDYRQFH